MIDVKLRVSPADDTAYVVAITLPTWVAAEDHFGAAVPKLFSSGDVGFKHLAWLAWEQTRREGQTRADFSTWLETIAGVDMEGDDAGPLDPTT